MRNNQEQNGEVKEERQGVDEEEEAYMAQNLAFPPLFMDGDAHNNNPDPPMNMEDDFLNNIWADGPAHSLPSPIAPPAPVPAQNEWADNEIGHDTSETLEDFLQKAGVLPPGLISNGPTTIAPYGPPQAPLQLAGAIPPGPTPGPYGPPELLLQRAGGPLPGALFQPYRPPPAPLFNLEQLNAEMAGRAAQINNRPIFHGPTVQLPYGAPRAPRIGPPNAQMAGLGLLPQARNLNLAGVGYGGQTIAAGNNTGGMCYPYNGSMGVGFGGFTCNPMEVPGLRVGPSLVAAGLTDGTGGSGDRGKRLVYEPEEVMAERRTRRKVKNRESAARSRARRQAYVITMEAERDRLQGENSRLRLRELSLLKEKPEEQTGPSTVRRCKSCSW